MRHAILPSPFPSTYEMSLRVLWRGFKKINCGEGSGKLERMA